LLKHTQLAVFNTAPVVSTQVEIQVFEAGLHY